MSFALRRPTWVKWSVGLLGRFPGLAHSGRAYSPAWERAHWSFEAATAHLAGYAVPRRVDRSGMVSVYHRNQYVGALHRGRTVYVMFDPGSIEWVFADEAGHQLRCRPAPEISREAILGLRVTHRRRGSHAQ